MMIIYPCGVCVKTKMKSDGHFCGSLPEIVAIGKRMV